MQLAAVSWCFRGLSGSNTRSLCIVPGVERGRRGHATPPSQEAAREQRLNRSKQPQQASELLAWDSRTPSTESWKEKKWALGSCKTSLSPVINANPVERLWRLRTKRPCSLRLFLRNGALENMYLRLARVFWNSTTPTLWNCCMVIVENLQTPILFRT